MEAQNGGFFQQTMYQPSTSHTQPSPHASFGGDPQGRYDSPGHFSQYNGAPLQPAPYPASHHQQFPQLQGGTGGDVMRGEWLHIWLATTGTSRLGPLLAHVAGKAALWTTFDVGAL